MRAICGAIISAGALIGLGLTAMAYAFRFQNSMLQHNTPETNTMNTLFGTPSMAIVLVTLILALLVGLGVTFVGLMYHHARRHHEMLHRESMVTGRPTQLP